MSNKSTIAHEWAVPVNRRKPFDHAANVECKRVKMELAKKRWEEGEAQHNGSEIGRRLLISLYECKVVTEDRYHEALREQHDADPVSAAKVANSIVEGADRLGRPHSTGYPVLDTALQIMTLPRDEQLGAIAMVNAVLADDDDGCDRATDLRIYPSDQGAAAELLRSVIGGCDATH